jgi:hypothetical protein
MLNLVLMKTRVMHHQQHETTKQATCGRKIMAGSRPDGALHYRNANASGVDAMRWCRNVKVACKILAFR